MRGGGGGVADRERRQLAPAREAARARQFGEAAHAIGAGEQQRLHARQIDRRLRQRAGSPAAARASTSMPRSASAAASGAASSSGRVTSARNVMLLPSLKKTARPPPSDACRRRGRAQRDSAAGPAVRRVMDRAAVGQRDQRAQPQAAAIGRQLGHRPRSACGRSRRAPPGRRAPPSRTGSSRGRSSGASSALQAGVVGADLDADGALGRPPAASPSVSMMAARLVEPGPAASARPPPAASHRPRRPPACASRVSHIAAQGHDLEVRPQRPAAVPGAAATRCRPRRRAAARRCSSPIWANSASRGSSRASMAPMTSPSGSQVGMSFIECTAQSMRPSSSASSISLVNSPLPPISISLRSCTASPVVLMRHDLEIVRPAQIGMGRRQAVAHHPRLHQRQRTPARTDADRLVISRSCPTFRPSRFGAQSPALPSARGWRRRFP